ncbi:MAG: 30S ribosomal protein S2 [Patescibacteria group bacterium]
MPNVSLKTLLEVGAHFGHQARRWNPKMAPYLFGVQEGVHVFDLVKTKEALEAALEALKNAAQEDKVILLLGSKKQAKEKIEEIGKEAGCPYVSERWLGGTLSNFDQMKRSLDKLSEMKAKMVSGEYNKFTKKERLLLEREIARLERFFGGISSLTKIPEMIVIVDTHKEAGAVREANRAGVSIVGIVDSNADPTLVDYPIPMNDDAAKALSYVLGLIKEAILEGKKKVKKAKKVEE